MQPSGHRQQNINTTHNNNEAVAHGPATSIFDTVDQRLSSAGMPTWNLGPYPVSPVVSAGFLLSFLMMGFRGLMFSGLLFFVVNYSRTTGDRNRPNSSSGFGGEIRSDSSNHRTATGNINQMRTLSNSQSNQGTSGNRNQDDPKKKYFTGAGHRLSWFLFDILMNWNSLHLWSNQ